MKHALLLGFLLLPATGAAAKPPAIQCPGNTTVEMRYCTSKSLEQSEAQLSKKLPGQQLQQWRDTTQRVCTQAYAASRDGTIYPQLVMGCDDRLNRALLQEFKAMDQP